MPRLWDVWINGEDLRSGERPPISGKLIVLELKLRGWDFPEGFMGIKELLGWFGGDEKMENSRLDKQCSITEIKILKRL